jgi:acyl-CoA dehydrogenase
MAIPVLPPPSAKAVEIGERVKAFLDEHIIPAEPIYHRQLDEGESRWHTPPIMNDLKARAKKAGLWNMFLPKKHYPDSLTNLEYASICETMGRSPIGGEPFNCSAPDTGNMETLILYATPEADRAGRAGEAQAPVDGAGADGYARRDDDALALGVRL